MAEKIVPMNFKWATISPDPVTAVMRNQFEPVDLIVQVGIPVQEEYLVNYEVLHEHALALSEHRELEIKAELSADIDSAGEGPGPYPEVPILTVEGMKFVVGALSLEGNSFEPDVEEEFEDDWDEKDDTVSSEDDAADEDDDFEDFDDDEEWEDE